MVSGAGFQQKAKEWAETLENMVDRPYHFVKSQIVIISNHIQCVILKNAYRLLEKLLCRLSRTCLKVGK